MPARRQCGGTPLLPFLVLVVCSAPAAVGVRLAGGPLAGGHAEAQTVLEDLRAAGRPDRFPKPLHVVEEKRCVARFYEAVRSLHGGRATDMVIGANDGKRFDPAMYMDYWSSTPNHTKIFIEPVPPLFRRLERNVASLGHVVTLNTAVVGPGYPDDFLLIYCWDWKAVDAAVQNGSRVLPKEARQPADYWTGLCSHDKSELMTASNVLDTPEFKALDPKDKDRVRLEVETSIRKYKIGVQTVEDIVREQRIFDAGYVQIDVEGMDNEIVRGLPLGKNGFLPKVILYENHHGDEVKPLLQSHGYEVCCCLQHQGNNMIAVLDSPSEDSNSWVRDHRECEEGLRSGLQGMFGRRGVDIVIGARDGKAAAIEPAPWFNYWANIPERQKLFVEASPDLANDVRANVQKASMHGAPISNVTVLTKTVRAASNGGDSKAEVFCWSWQTLTDARAGRETLPSSVRQPKDEWEYLCADSKQRVLELAKVLETPAFAQLSAEEKARVQAQVEEHLVSSSVETASVEDVLDAAGPRYSVRYLQLHPSEHAAELVPALPLGRHGFLPDVITYGREGSAPADEALKAQGYNVCCCVERGGASTMVATRNK